MEMTVNFKDSFEKHITLILSKALIMCLIFMIIWCYKYYRYPHFTDFEPGAQKGQRTCSRSHR